MASKVFMTPDQVTETVKQIQNPGGVEVGDVVEQQLRVAVVGNFVDVADKAKDTLSDIATASTASLENAAKTTDAELKALYKKNSEMFTSLGSMLNGVLDRVGSKIA